MVHVQEFTRGQDECTCTDLYVLVHSSFQGHLQVENDHFWSWYDITKLALMPHHGFLYEFHPFKIVENMLAYCIFKEYSHHIASLHGPVISMMSETTPPQILFLGYTSQ